MDLHKVHIYNIYRQARSPRFTHSSPILITSTRTTWFLVDRLEAMDFVFPYQTFHPMPNTDRGVDQTFEETVERYAVPNTTKAIHLWHCTWQNGGNNQGEVELH